MQIITGIKITGVEATFKQMSELRSVFNTFDIDNADGLQIKCLLKMNSTTARQTVKDILNCKYSQIRFKYHEKNIAKS